MSKRAFAIACHPDDLEFGMMGTMMLLKDAGYEVHYMNVSNGSLGTDYHDYQTIVRMRREEALNSAKLVGAVFHESICDDIEVFYNYENLAKLVPVVREVEPEIILTQGPYDYMEDHINAGRLAVTAAFCRGMVNMKCAPTAKPTLQNVAVYHCMPHSITDQLRRPVEADFYVNIASKMEIKRQALACHKSQKEWLDVSQGMDAYIKDMENRAAIFGRQSGEFEFAEGWVQHNPLGFGPENFNPLTAALKDFVKLMPHAIR